MSDQTKKPVYINRENFTDKIKSYLRHPGSMILMFLVMFATFITFALLLFLIFYILINGIPYIKPSLFSLHYTSDNASVIPALINTVVMTLLSLLIAVPFGIFSAIFLVEYAGKGNKFIEVIRLTTETLSGIPSIVYGLFGMLFFVNTKKFISRTPDITGYKFYKSYLSDCRDSICKQEDANESYRQHRSAGGNEEHSLHDFFSPCF